MPAAKNRGRHPEARSIARSLQRLDVGGRQRLSANSPGAAGDFLDADPGDAAQGFAFDLDHRVGHFFDHVLFLIGGENTFDNLNVDEWHDVSFQMFLGFQRVGTTPLREDIFRRQRECMLEDDLRNC